MPVFPNKVPDLVSIGPIIEVILYPSKPVFDQFKKEGKSVPSKKVIALIDTGASGSCFHHQIARELGLVAHDEVPVGTPAGITMQLIYDMCFSLPSLTNTILPIVALGANLEQQPYKAFIGRDILKDCTLIYNGWDNSYQLHI